MRMVSPVPMVLLLCGLLFVSPMATAVPPKKVAALGRFEPRGGVIAIAAPPGERIEQLPVAVGSVVAAGADLAILSGHKARLLQLELTRKQRDEARERAAANLAAACALHAEATLGVEAAGALGDDGGVLRRGEREEGREGEGGEVAERDHGFWGFFIFFFW